MNEVRYRDAERRLWEWVGVTPTEQLVQLGRTGVTLRIQEVGRGPAVVFVHGATNSGVSWAPLISRLDGYRCVLLDRPGCGLSPPLVTRFDDVESIGAFADTLVVDVLDALGLDAAHVVATSFGGYIALRTAAAHPDRIGRMVEFGWTVGASRMPLFMRLTGVPMVGRLLAAVPLNERAVRMMLRRIGLRQALETGRFTQEMLDCYVALLRDTGTMRNELRAFPRLMDDPMVLPVSLLAKIRTPVHFLWGEQDPFGGADIARQFVEHIPNAELELMPDAGHAVWIDDPDHVATTTRKFLGQ